MQHLGHGASNLNRRCRAAQIGRTRSLAQGLLDRAGDGSRGSSLPQMLEHHRARPDLSNWIGDALTREIGADPWTGSNIDGCSRSGLRFADGAIAMVPAQAGPRSDRMSPNRLDATT